MKDRQTDHKLNIDLEIQNNTNASEIETYVTMEMDAKVQNEPEL